MRLVLNVFAASYCENGLASFPGSPLALMKSKNGGARGELENEATQYSA